MILEIKNLDFQYNEDKMNLRNISFELDRGEIISILGANGVGKSTLFKIIMGILYPKNGEIKLDEKNLKKYTSKEIAKKIGYVKQYNESSYEYTVRDFLIMGRAPYIGLMQNPQKEDWYIVEQVIKRLGLEDFANRNMNELSGGQNQLIFLGRALVQNPKIILLDEPTNHLDLGNQYKILKMIKDLAKEGYSILMTTHFPDHVILLEGKVGIISDEGSMKFGTVKELLTEEMLEDIYKTGLKKIYVEELGRDICTFKKI